MVQVERKSFLNLFIRNLENFSALIFEINERKAGLLINFQVIFNTVDRKAVPSKSRESFEKTRERTG